MYRIANFSMGGPDIRSSPGAPGSAPTSLPPVRVGGSSIQSQAAWPPRQRTQGESGPHYRRCVSGETRPCTAVSPALWPSPCRSGFTPSAFLRWVEGFPGDAQRLIFGVERAVPSTVRLPLMLGDAAGAFVPVHRRQVVRFVLIDPVGHRFLLRFSRRHSDEGERTGRGRVDTTLCSRRRFATLSLPASRPSACGSRRGAR